MFDSSSEASGVAANSFHTAQNRGRQDEAIIKAGDIRSPWKSVYGFPMTAARLASGQELVLHCREDEVFDYLAQLNEFLGTPENLNRTYHLLEKLAQATQQKFDQPFQLREQPLSDSEIPDLMAEAEEILTGPVEETVVERLTCLLSPDNPIREIAGLGKMLTRLQGLMAALIKVKDQGFKVVVINRRRQPKRPALEARRNEPVMIDGKPSQILAGFLLPANYHLTLWAYVVATSDGGQFVA